MPTPLAETERRTFFNLGGGKPLHGALMYHWARMIEMLHAAEMRASFSTIRTSWEPT